MAKLSTLPPRLPSIAPTLGRAPADAARAPTRRQRDNAPWRAWYKTERWRALRQKILIRDAYTCQRTGVVCDGKYPAPNSPVVNHRRPHRGNEALFWDEDNLETVSKAEHDSAIQREEQASLHQRGVWT